MTRIFISYDRDDRPFTRQLAARLRRVYGYVWFDENLFGGEDWWNEIRRQIATADIFIYLLTNESLQSPYCQAEFAEARRLKKEILPVMLERIEDIPENLRQIQYVDLSDGELNLENFTELNAALKQLSDRVAQQQQIVPLQRQTRRVSIFWSLVGITALLVVVLVLLLATTPPPPFQGQLAFASGAEANRDIMVLDGGLSGLFGNLTGNNPHPIARRTASESVLTWSPDSNWIAFASDRDGNSEIYIMTADGKNVQRLTNTPADDWHPTWSIDGRIAYTSAVDETNSDIFVMDVDTTDPANVIVTNIQALVMDPAADDFPVWSPDGRLLAFSSNRTGDWEIYVGRGDGSDLRNLSRNAADDQSPAWSPDGAQIAFESNRVRRLQPGSIPGQLQAAAGENWDIYVAYVDESGTVQFTQSPGDDRYPAWSPDGLRLAFVSNRDGDDDLYLVDVSDRRKVTLLTDNVSDDLYPVWRG